MDELIFGVLFLSENGPKLKNWEKDLNWYLEYIFGNFNEFVLVVGPAGTLAGDIAPLIDNIGRKYYHVSSKRALAVPQCAAVSPKVAALYDKTVRFDENNYFEAFVRAC